MASIWALTLIIPKTTLAAMRAASTGNSDALIPSGSRILRLLTTHEVADAETAWQIVDWYRRPARTAKQRNPHTPASLAWAAYVIGRLGGWDGYPSSRPPGPITFRHGLEYLKALVDGWKMLNDVCMP